MPAHETEGPTVRHPDRATAASTITHEARGASDSADAGPPQRPSAAAPKHADRDDLNGYGPARGADDRDIGIQPPSRTASALVRRTLVALGVLVPLAVLTFWAAHLVPAFDGAMNLQVAASLADGNGYARFYGGREVFPSEIETSGPFVFLAALIIKVFGMSFFTLEVPNLIFLAVLLAGISAALRPWPLAQVIGPSLVLLCVPGMTGLAAGGLGEFPVAGVLLWALILQATVIMGAGRPVLRMAASAVLVGVAMTIKVVAIAVLPVAALGLLLALVVRRDTSRVKLALAPLALALPVGAYELYRLSEFGSGDGYWAFWTGKSSQVVMQAGLEPDAVPVSRLQKGADHMHLLAVQSGVPAESLVLLLVTPGILLALAFLLRGTGWREWLASPGRALAVLLTSYSYLYFVWWLFVTPTEKAWLRRIIIAVVLLGVVYALLSGMGLDRLRRIRSERAGMQWAVGAVAALAAVAFATAAVISVAPTRQNLDALLFPTRNSQEAVTSAVDEVERLDAEGKVIFGGDWWSAPVLSLLADVPFEDIKDLDACSPDDVDLLTSGDAVFVWDRYARGIIGPVPTQLSLEFQPISKPSDYAEFWTLSLVPDACRS